MCRVGLVVGPESDSCGHLHIDEAQDLVILSPTALGHPPKNMLELGAAWRVLYFHDLQTLYPEVEVTLVDSSAAMIAQEAHTTNPKGNVWCTAMPWGILDLSEQFDCRIVLHDAVMYLPRFGCRSLMQLKVLLSACLEARCGESLCQTYRKETS